VAISKEAAAKLVAEAESQARLNEHMSRLNRKSSTMKRERFCALVVDSRQTQLAELLAGFVEFLRPGLVRTGEPWEACALTSSFANVHVAFLWSAPDFRSDGEYLLTPFPLPRYAYVEHEKRNWNRYIESQQGTMRICSTDINEFDDEVAEPFAPGARVDQLGPWKLLEKSMGVGLTSLRRALETAEPVWLVCRRLIVLPGVEQVPVRGRGYFKP
jgi:hypothetical protein